MMRLRAGILVLCLTGLWITMTSAQEIPYRIIGYYASWNIYDRQFFVTDIPADKLTHINYAFVNISEDGECLIGDAWADTQFPYPGDEEGAEFLGNFRQLNLLKEAHPHLQTLLSIGGWSWSDYFSDVALTEESRAKFARSCVAMMKQYGFDGLDIDWEYPGGGGEAGNVERPEDPQNFTLLLAELRAQLETQGQADGRHYLLTIAAPARAWGMELDKITAYLDWINVMTYDFNGAWSAVTGFNAPLYGDPDAPNPTQSVDHSIQGYLAAGVPAEQLVMGVPFYGRGWAGVGDTNDGLYQPYTRIPGSGDYDYGDLTENYIGQYTRHWNEAAQVPWLYDAEAGMMITYDDPESLAKKAAYIREQGLGGAMIWEVGLDDEARSLITALYDALHE
jgi:chitinase